MPAYDRPFSFIPEAFQRRPLLQRQGPVARAITRALMAYEDRQGRERLLPAYQDWQNSLETDGDLPFRSFLEKTGTDVTIDDPTGALSHRHEGPLVIVANHVYGAMDGFILCHLIERLQEQPRAIGALPAFSPVPELVPYLFRVDSFQPPRFPEINEAAKSASMDWLAQGGTIALCPSGRVASPERKGQTPMEYHWKTFAARMVMGARADVLPVFFHGHPGPQANPARRWGKMAEILSMISMFYSLTGGRYRVSVGAIRRYESLRNVDDRHKLTTELRDLTFALSDGVESGDIAPGTRAV